MTLSNSLSVRDLRAFGEFLEAAGGFRFDRHNAASLERALRKRMHALRIDSFPHYLEHLRSAPERSRERSLLFQALTVGETFFLRYPHQFDVLKQSILPEIAKKAQGGLPRLRAWSAGCSTGEEPYSIALTVIDSVPGWRNWDIRIVGTDLNERSLKRAREGLYGPRAVRLLSTEQRERHLVKTSEEFELSPEVRGLVEFFPLNLRDNEYSPLLMGHGEFDVIFCRNVLMYMSQAAARHIVGKLAAALRPGGALFLGHAETLAGLSRCFEPVSGPHGYYYLKRHDAGIAGSKGVTLPVPDCSDAEATSVVAAPDPDQLYRLACNRFNGGDGPGAQEALGELLSLAPGHAPALSLQGLILARSGLLPEAWAICESCVRQNDLLPEAYYVRGLIREMVAEEAEAIAEYRKALLLDMSFVMPHYALAHLFIRRRQVAEGARELRNALKYLKNSREEIIRFSGGLTRTTTIVDLQRELTELSGSPG